MSARSRHICLVTPGHLSTNPRLVKEADALAAAGYRVSVVAARFIPWADEADREFADRPWSVRKVAFGPLAGRPRRLAQGLRRRACLRAHRLFGRCAESAFHPVFPALARAAGAIRADLYIAHNLAALPAAAKAASLHGAKLGFDAEDFHSGEMNDTPENALRLRLTREIERRYLPLCHHLTAASPGIGRAYAEAYGLEPPLVVLNVFPKSDAPAGVSEKGGAAPSPSLYWFSQTIGPDRGLETAIEAIALSRSKPTLFLRGNPSRGYSDILNALIAQSGIGDRVRFLPPHAPNEMVRLASDYDVGLASEPGHTENNRLALSNKLFTFLLAGTPALVSDTPAQAEIAECLGDAVSVYQRGNARSLAAKMDDLLLSPPSLSAARQAAWEFGQQRFNWDIEQQALVRAVDSVWA